MIEMVQGDLEKLHRRAAMNIITLEAHSRDINKKMIAMGVDRKDHFEWLGQLKTNWEKHVGHAGQTPELDQGQEYDAVLYICDALFRYSFEYLGAAGRPRDHAAYRPHLHHRHAVGAPDPRLRAAGLPAQARPSRPRTFRPSSERQSTSSIAAPRWTI